MAEEEVALAVEQQLVQFRQSRLGDAQTSMKEASNSAVPEATKPPGRCTVASSSTKPAGSVVTAKALAKGA